LYLGGEKYQFAVAVNELTIYSYISQSTLCIGQSWRIEATSFRVNIVKWASSTTRSV